MLIDLVRRLQGNCDGYAGVRRMDLIQEKLSMLQGSMSIWTSRKCLNQYVNFGPRSVAGWDGARYMTLTLTGVPWMKHLVSFTREKEQAKGVWLMKLMLYMHQD